MISSLHTKMPSLKICTTLPNSLHIKALESGIKWSDALKVGIYLILAMKKHGISDRKKILKISKKLLK